MLNNRKKDALLFSTHKKEKIEIEVFDTALGVEKEKKEIYSNFGLQYTYEIIKILVIYRVQYRKGYNYQYFQTFAYLSYNKLTLGKINTKKRPISHIFIVH